MNNNVAGDVVSIGSSTTATITGSGGTIGICGVGIGISASNQVIATVANASFALTGSGDTITLGATSTVAISGGTDDTVLNSMAGDNVYVGSNTSVRVRGSSGNIGINGINITLAATSQFVQTVAGASLNLTGSTNTVTLGAGSTLGLQRQRWKRRVRQQQHDCRSRQYRPEPAGQQ